MVQGPSLKGVVAPKRGSLKEGSSLRRGCSLGSLKGLFKDLGVVR